MDETEIDGRLMMLQRQRDEALNQCVLMAGLLAKVQKELEALKPREQKAE